MNLHEKIDTLTKVSETIRDHLIAQRAQSLDEDGDCVYRSSGGLRCAAGCLIADSDYSFHLEGKTASTAEVFNTILRSLGLTECCVERELDQLIGAWQHYHDDTHSFMPGAYGWTASYPAWLAGDVTHNPSIQHQVILNCVTSELTPTIETTNV